MKLLKCIISVVISIACCVNNVFAYDEQAVLNTLRLGVENYLPSVDISQYKVPTEDIGNLATKLLFGQPKYFYVDKQVSGVCYPDYGILKSIDFKYTVDKDELPSKIKELNDVALEIINGANKYTTDYQKLLYVHDWFVYNIKYDYSYQNHDMYNALVNKSVVCEGITYAYGYILNNLGINNSAAMSDSMNHIWNTVQLDGKWYNIDLTSDIANAEVNGYSSAYFLKSDDFLEYYNFKDWYTFNSLKCSSTDYDKYIWRSTKIIKISDKITLNLPYIMKEEK
jgi:hypothetical protein